MRPIQNNAAFKSPRVTIGDLDADTAARVMAAMMTMVKLDIARLQAAYDGKSAA